MKIDSLLFALQNAKEDTHKVNLLNALAGQLMYNNPDTAIILSNQALSIANKLKWKKGVANSLGRLGGVYWNQGDYPKALEHYFKALEIDKELGNKSGIAKHLGNIGVVYQDQGNYPKALEHYFKASEIFIALGNKSGVATGLGNIGGVYYEQGDYPKALEHLFKSLEIDKELGNKSGIAADLSNIGLVYDDQGDYPKALEHYFKALEIFNALGNKSRIATVLSNIGVVYRNQSDYPKALKHYFKALEIDIDLGNKSGIAARLGNIGGVYYEHGNYPKALEHHFMALEIAKELGDKSGIAIDLGNIGNVYDGQGDYPKALEHYFKALEISKELGNKNGIAIWLSNIGGVYDDQGDYTKALEHYFKTLEIFNALENKSEIAIVLGNIGVLYTNQKRFTEAEDFLNRSLSVAEEIGFIDRIKEDHQNLSELFWELGILRKTKQYEKYENRTSADYYKLALEHYEKYLRAKDTLFNEEKSVSIGKMEGRHEFALIEMEQERAEREHALAAAAEIKRRNQVQFTGIIALLLLVILIVSLLLFSKFNVTPRIKTGSLFIALLLLFEFMLVWFDPTVEKFTGGDPFYKLLINGILALGFYFIQQLTVKLLPVAQKVTTNKVNTPVVCILCILCLVQFSAFVPWWQEKEIKSISHQNTKALNNTKTDSLKLLLSQYQTQITTYRSQNKIKEALETLKIYGDAKDSLQQQEQSQEFTRLNEKHALEFQKAKQKVEEEERAKYEKEKKERSNLLEYSIILIALIFIFIALSVTGRIRMGKFTLPHRVLEGGLFVSFLLLFEFILVFADPYIEQYTGGAPAWKFGFNVVIAALIFPVHAWLEKKMKSRLIAN